MDNQTPLVTVLMPVYNGERYLREAIDSILEQTFRDFEFLIMNDGSTDQSVKIIEEFEDPRINLVHNESNLGLIKTLNKGLDLIQSKYIVRMDADDISLPNRLSVLLNFMEDFPEVILCGSWFDNFNKNGVSSGGRYATNHNEIRLRHLYQIQICHGSCIIRNSDSSNKVRFNSEFEHAEDYDFFERLCHIGSAANIPKVLYLVRQHDTNVSVKFRKVQLRNTDKVRVRALSRLGGNFDITEANIYRALQHQNYAAPFLTLDNVRSILSRMFVLNEHSRFFDSDILEKELTKLWFHYLNANRNLLTVSLSNALNSELFFSYKHLSWLEIAKVFSRSMFR